MRQWTFGLFVSRFYFSIIINFARMYLLWELDCEEGWTLKNWCFWTVVLEKTLESPLDGKEIQPVHSEGDQPWDFFGRTDAKAEIPVLWPPHAQSWLIGKDSGYNLKDMELLSFFCLFSARNVESLFFFLKFHRFTLFYLGLYLFSFLFRITEFETLHLLLV